MANIVTSGIYIGMEGTESELSARQINREITWATDLKSLRYLDCNDLVHYITGSGTINYLQDSGLFLQLIGGTMLGDINMSGNNISSSESNLPLLVDSGYYFTVNNSGLIYDATTHNVGISDSTPSERLTVGAGNIQLDNAYSYKGKDCSNTALDLLKLHSDDYLYVGPTSVVSGVCFQPGSSAKMTLLSNGYLGLGTNEPTHNFHISSSSNAEMSFESDVNATFFINADKGAGGSAIPSLRFLINDSEKWRMSVNATNDDFTLGVGPSGKIYITSLGNIGIGNNNFGTNSTNSIGLANGTEPASSIAGQIQLYSKDSSAGSTNATLGFRTEQAVESIGTFTASHKLRIWINQVEYYITLDAV